MTDIETALISPFSEVVLEHSRIGAISVTGSIDGNVFKFNFNGRIIAVDIIEKDNRDYGDCCWVPVVRKSLGYGWRFSMESEYMEDIGRSSAACALQFSPMLEATEIQMAASNIDPNAFNFFHINSISVTVYFKVNGQFECASYMDVPKEDDRNDAWSRLIIG